jgi:hypothetical protein
VSLDRNTVLDAVLMGTYAKARSIYGPHIFVVWIFAMPEDLMLAIFALMLTCHIRW